MKLVKLVDSIVIGINLWFVPQISEHWPKNNPGRFIKSKVWLSRPGIESILIPKAGIAQEWITSIEEVRIRIGNLNGKIQRLSTSRSRNSLGKSWSVGIMNESKSIFLKSEYSYLQYHWCPRALTVRLTLKISSVR